MAFKRGYVPPVHTEYVELETAIDVGSDLGLDFIELVMDGETERRSLDVDRITELLRTNGLDLVVHLPFIDIDVGSPRRRVRQGGIGELERCIEVASELGAEKAVMHPSSHATRGRAWEKKEVQRQIVESIDGLEQFSTNLGVELCIENIDEGTFPAQDFELIFDETDASMTLDTGHAKTTDMEDHEMKDFASRWKHRISHVHINDTRGPKDEHLPTGAGTIDLASIFEPLTDGWDGTFSIEADTYNFDYVEISADQLDAILETQS